jgi:3-oxoadipate CoA-transferase beta subunit
VPGAAYFHHADSFCMIRGGHIDVCVLGTMQVAQNGDIANWSTGEPGAIPAVGGAMDLATGARKTFVMMPLLTRAGESKIVAHCSYPLTAPRCVSRIYTDHAVVDVTAEGLALRELVPGLDLDGFAKLAGVTVRDGRGGRGLRDAPVSAAVQGRGLDGRLGGRAAG